MIRCTVWVVAAMAAMLTIARSVDAQEDVVFEDRFENDLADGWNWIREDAAHWCIRQGALEIRVVRGLADTVRNALVRQAPDRNEGAVAIEVTVTNLTQPVQQYEQAGITWYQDDKPVFKLVKELVDGQAMIIPGRQAVQAGTVRLRLVVTADSYIAQYRADGEGEGEFHTAATGKLPPPGNDKVSLQCYNGPPRDEHWIRFDDFRILRVKDSARAAPRE